MHRIPWQFEDEEEACIQKKLDAGVIQEYNSDWASPPVFIRKKDGTIRYAKDYTRLNACTVKSSVYRTLNIAFQLLTEVCISLHWTWLQAIVKSKSQNPIGIRLLFKLSLACLSMLK